MARIIAPLTGTITTGTWVTDQRLTVAAMPNGFMNYNYLLPFGYNAGGTTTYPVLFYGHTNDEGMNGSTYPSNGANLVNQNRMNGSFNTVAFRTNFPSIVVVPQCDQTLDTSGGNANANFGGYADTPNSGGNERGVNALLAYILANFKGDPASCFCTGDSLGGIGSCAWMVDNNAINGTNKLWAAGMGFSDNLYRSAPNDSASVFARMATVPYIAISTTNDNDPTGYDQPAWRSYTGNSNYPTPSTFTSGGINAIRAGTNNFWYIATTAGVPWPAYRQLNADGGLGTPLYTLLFSFAGTGTAVVTKPTPASVIALFKSIAGKNTISGQYIERGNNTTTGFAAIQAIQAKTGKWLGMIQGDFWYSGSSIRTVDTTIVQYLIDYWNAGGLVSMVVVPPHPTSGGSAGDASTVDANAVVTPGTTANTNLNTSLDSMASAYKTLDTNGVVCIHRIFPEMNGNWIWWGAQNFSAAQFIAMWRYAHDRLTITNGLTNLVFDWSPNAGGSIGGRTDTDTYPGDAYVDIMGWSGYTTSPKDVAGIYATISAIAAKPVSYSEFGPGLNPVSGFDERILISQMKQYLPNAVFFMQWWSGGAPWGIEQTDQNFVTAAITDPYVLNRGDFQLSSTTTTIIPSRNNTVITPGTGTITDSGGGIWSITAGGQSVYSGTTNTGTSGLIRVAYVNNQVWQENSALNWFLFAAGVYVSGPTTTSPLPAISSNNTFYTTVGPTIIDAAYNTWAISSGAQMVINGNVDTTTANLVEIAYVNNLIWHKNTSANWYSISAPGAGYVGPTTVSPLTIVPGGLSYIQPMFAAGMRVITYIKQEQPASFTTGLAALRAEQAANHDIFAYEGCQEPDTAVITGTQETIAGGASFQATVWSAGQADAVPIIQTSFGVLANYGTTGNLSASATYGNAHVKPGNVSGNAGTAPGLISTYTTAALTTTPGRGVCHTEFSWANDHNSTAAISAYTLNYIMSGFFDFNLPYMIYNGLFDDASGQYGLFNNDTTPRQQAATLANLFTLLNDTGANALSFGGGKLNISVAGLPASPSGPYMGGKIGVLQKSNGEFWVMLNNEQTLTTPDPAHTFITVAPVNVTVTLGTLCTSADVYDPMISTVSQQRVNNTSSFMVSLPAHPILIRIIRP